jgi:hypothetical protein
LKATAAASAQVSKFFFHMAIPGIKLSHLVHDMCSVISDDSYIVSLYITISFKSENILSG